MADTKSVLVIARWIARAFSVLIAAFLWFMLVAHILNPNDSPPLGMVSFMLVLPLGLLVGWRWELIGSAIALAALVSFHVIMYANRSVWGLNPFIDIAALPAAFYFLCWHFSRTPSISDGAVASH